MNDAEKLHKKVQVMKDFKTIHDFIEKVYELAFGEDALIKDYTQEEVLARLKEFSDKAFMWDGDDDGIAVRSNTHCRLCKMLMPFDEVSSNDISVCIDCDDTYQKLN